MKRALPAALLACGGVALAGQPDGACADESCWRPRFSHSLSTQPLRLQLPASRSLAVSLPVRNMLSVPLVREAGSPRAPATPGAVWMTGLGLARQFDLAERQSVQVGDVLRARLALSAETFRESAALSDGAEARLVSPRLLFRSADTTRFLDVGYTEAQYAMPAPGVPSYRLSQFAPALGFELAPRQEWFTLRLYDVRSPDAARNLATPMKTRAVETKWVRNLYAQDGGPDQLQVSTLFGNRLHAVDPDSASIFSLTDMQTGGLSVGASWSISPYAKWMVNGGYDRFEQGGLGGPEYANAYIFTGLKGRW